MPEVREIPLTRGHVAIVDADDFERLGTVLWQAYERAGFVYAFRSWRDGIGGPVRKTYMHREVIGAPSGFTVKFRTSNTLDCRRSNLTFAGAA